MTNRTTALKALTAAGALVVLAACGSSGGSGGTTSGGSTSGGGSTSAGTPVHGGKLTFAAVQDAQSMNKTTVFDNNSIWIFEQIFQQLYTVSTDGKSVVPQLATGYKVSSDKKTYTFTLRQGVKFSNGQPMTSKDVKFSIDQNTKASQGWGFINTAIKSVPPPRRPTPSSSTSSTRGRRCWPTCRSSPTASSRTTTAARPRPRSTTRRSAPARSSGTSGTRASP